MAAGKEVATKEAAPVPALAHQPALDIDSDDIRLPRIKIGQYMSGLVQEGVVNAGDIFASTGDDDAEVLWASGSKDDGVLFHVLSMTKAKSAQVDGELEVYDFNDPEAPAEAWTTYNYVVCLPEADDGDEVPYKWLLTRTGRAAAQTINTVLKKNVGRGPAWINAFRVTTAQRENKKGKFYVARITQVEADPKHVDLAEGLAVHVASSTPAPQLAASSEPAI